jgi:arylsulfatase A
LIRFNGRYQGSKGHVLEGGIRVPAIVRWPENIGEGRSINHLVHFTDWVPTILEVAGAPEADRAPALFDGRSVLSELITESHPEERRRFYWQWNRYLPERTCNAAARNGRWKLVRPMISEAMYVDPEDSRLDKFVNAHPEEAASIVLGEARQLFLPAPPAPLLFDLDEDPYEQQDLATEHPTIVRQLSQELDRWFDEVERDRARAHQ